MRLTLSLADFSGTGKNIGTLNSWFISKNTPSGLTWTTAPSSVDKGTDFNAVAEIDTANYELVTISVTMGTTTQTGVGTSGGITISNSGSQYTIYISSVTANVNISVTTKNLSTGLPDSGGGTTPTPPPSSGGTTTTTLPLAQGYIDKGSVNNELTTRVRSDGLASGAFSVEVNSGYLIRAIYEHTKQDLSDGGTAIVTSADTKTSYSGGTAGKYYAFTFCKSDATKALSPTENIIKSFSGTIVPIETSGGSSSGGTTTTPTPGTDVTYTLVQGAHVENDSALYVGANRVTTDVAIKGKFTVTVNDGYCIRAVYAYTKASGDTKGTMVLQTSTSATTFTSTDNNKYYGVTFTKAGDAANNNIAPTEAIVKSWKYV